MITAQCFICSCFCGFFVVGMLSCDAFPTGIPTEILTGAFDHREPHEGDNGVRFEPIDPSLVEDGEDDYPTEERPRRPASPSRPKITAAAPRSSASARPASLRALS